MVSIERDVHFDMFMSWWEMMLLKPVQACNLQSPAVKGSEEQSEMRMWMEDG